VQRLNADELQEAEARRHALIRQLEAIVYYQGHIPPPKHSDIIKAIELMMKALGMLKPESVQENIGIRIESRNA
jgi:hypothetical protein